jgi:hypothetical protein
MSGNHETEKTETEATIERIKSDLSWDELRNLEVLIHSMGCHQYVVNR